MADAKILEINPLEAQALLTEQPGARLIDVRSKMEFDYVGHPIVAIHVPWKEFPSWDENPNFCDDVRKALEASGIDGLDTPVLMLCRSGVRSKNAGNTLIKEGFGQVYNVLEGFEGDKDDSNHRGTLGGWRFRGLAWEQG
ncbi:MAG: rhodanese-like domain-containing protein [Gammaproteobacteria bacterium]